MPPRLIDTLTREEQTALHAVLAEDTALACGYELRLRFHTIVNTRNIDALDTWLAAAHESPLSPFLILARGIARDLAALEAVLTFDWPRREDLVHRLELIKRQC